MALANTATVGKRGGFTLIELMITVAIVAILASIAIPAYQGQVRKSRRVEAKTALLDLASREERLFATTNAYSVSPAALGYGAAAAGPITIGSGYYSVTLALVAGPPPSYLLTATPLGAQTQDTTCATFTVNGAGVQNATTATCW
jgi:type IV pilus assembly protein PilE